MGIERRKHEINGELEEIVRSDECSCPSRKDALRRRKIEGGQTRHKNDAESRCVLAPKLFMRLHSLSHRRVFAFGIEHT